MEYNINARFEPISKSISRAEIWTFFFTTGNDELSNKQYFVNVVNDKISPIPNFYACEIPDDLCQEFVNRKYDIDKTNPDPIQYMVLGKKMLKELFKKISSTVKKQRVAIVKKAAKESKRIEREAAKQAKKVAQ